MFFHSLLLPRIPLNPACLLRFVLPKFLPAARGVLFDKQQRFE
jgi:hypothetical protein